MEVETLVKANLNKSLSPKKAEDVLKEGKHQIAFFSNEDEDGFDIVGGYTVANIEKAIGALEYYKRLLVDRLVEMKKLK